MDRMAVGEEEDGDGGERGERQIIEYYADGNGEPVRVFSSIAIGSSSHCQRKWRERVGVSKAHGARARLPWLPTLRFPLLLP